MAVGVGSMRGSAVNRLRPVGSTSRRPRCGEPAGPGLTRLPSSAAIRASRSAAALAGPCRVVAVGSGAAIDMQPVLDGEVLEVAQPGVDLAQRLVGVDVARRRRPRGRARFAAALSTMSRARRSRRRRSSPSAMAYSSTSRSSSCAAPDKLGARRAAAADGRWSRRRCGAWPAPPLPGCETRKG